MTRNTRKGELLMVSGADKLRIEWDKPNPFVVFHEVGGTDIDELGHSNNVCYLSWLERCAWEHSAAVGFDVHNMLAINHAMVVRDTRMQYLLATFAGDRLQIGDWIVDCDRKLRATRAFQIVREQDSKTVMRAEIDYVCINIESGRPSRMPAEFITAYADMSSV